MRAATIAALLFLLLLASLASAQTLTPAETISPTLTSNIPILIQKNSVPHLQKQRWDRTFLANDNTSNLTGTVTASHQGPPASVVYEIFLHNAGSTDLISFTVKITNTTPIGQITVENYPGFENDPECETGQDMCSSAFVESLSASESITLTIEHSTAVPATCSYDNNLPPFIQALRDADEVVENSIEEFSDSGLRKVRWTSIRPLKAVAVFDENTIVDLQVSEPLTYYNATCFFPYIEQPPLPTPVQTPAPTSEPSTILLPVFAKE